MTLHRFVLNYDELEKSVPENKYVDFLDNETQKKYEAHKSSRFIHLARRGDNRKFLLPIKCHFNFGSKDNIKKGWNIVIPILMAHPEIFRAVKVIDIEAKITRVTEILSDIDTILIPHAKKAILDSNLLQLKLSDLNASKAHHLAEMERYLTCAPVTFYLFSNKEGKLDAEATVKVMNNISAALEKAGIEASPGPDTDFRLNKHVSVRLDKHDGAYINTNLMFLPEIWHMAKNNKDIQSLVSPDELNKKRPDFVLRPFSVLADDLKKKLKAEIKSHSHKKKSSEAEVKIAEIQSYDIAKKILDAAEKVINLIKIIHPTLSIAAKSGLEEMEKWLSYRSLARMERLAGIINCAQTVLFNSWDEKQIAEKETKDAKTGETPTAAFFKSREVVAPHLMDNFFRPFAFFEDKGSSDSLLKRLNEIATALQKSPAQEQANMRIIP